VSSTIRSADHAAARAWLDGHRAGAGAEEALAFFDGLPAVGPEEMLGRWRGSGLPTGSPLDGLLEYYGWYGKEFTDAETVHPLLFTDRTGRPRPVDPALVPIGLLRDHAGLAHRPAVRRAFGVLKPVLWTSRPKARLRVVEHRGVLTTAMVYDALPIIDVFRRVDDATLLGLMDLRGLSDPFFFVLGRDRPGAGC
jgi:hypothetical protein